MSTGYKLVKSNNLTDLTGLKCNEKIKRFIACLAHKLRGRKRGISRVFRQPLSTRAHKLVSLNEWHFFSHCRSSGWLSCSSAFILMSQLFSSRSYSSRISFSFHICRLMPSFFLCISPFPPLYTSSVGWMVVRSLAQEYSRLYLIACSVVSHK